MGNLQLTMTPKKKAVAIFLLSAIVRVIVDIIYLVRYGWHTTPVTETYYYYGVANGTVLLSHYDITYWLLHTVGSFIHGETLLYAVYGMGLLISSFAAVLVYIFARTMLDDKGSVVAALVYTFMLQPLAMGVLLFTHDLVQMPVFLLLLYAGLKLKEKRSVFWGIAFIPLFLMGLEINPLIILAAETLLLYYGYALVQRFWEKKAFFVMVGGFALILALLILLNIMDASERIIVMTIEALSKVSYAYGGLLQTFKTGSPDFVPTTVHLLWQRYNILFLLLPFGIVSFFKKRNAFLFSLFFVGLFTALLFDRATRVVDLAFALIAAEALTSWDSGWNGYLTHATVAAFVLAFLAATTGFFSASIFLPFLVIFPVVYLLWKFSSGRASLILCIFIVYNVFDMGFLTHPPQISEAEYEAYRFLGTQKGEWVLTAWDNGFAALAVSRKMPFCSPVNLDNTYQIALMKRDEEEALKIVEKNNIDFIVVTTARFSLEQGRVVAWRFFLDYAGKPLSEKEKRETLLFRMLYKEDSLKSFAKIFEKRDESTGVITKVFIPIA